MYRAAKKAEKHPLTGSCLPSKLSILSLSMKNRTPVKNKHPTVFPTARWSHFFSSCPSVATSPSHTLLCNVGDETLHPTACSARASGGRREAPRRKDAAPSMSPSFASSPWRRRFLPGAVVGLLFAVFRHPQTSLISAHFRGTDARPAAALLWTNLRPQNSSADPLTPSVTVLKFGLLGST